MTAENHECITLCWEARTTCLDTLMNHCLVKGGAHVDADHVKIMLDCIELCQVTADFLKRGSELHRAVCTACASVCEACARSCEIVGKDEKMKHCAEVCRRAAEACQQEGRKLNRAA
ncbi:MAG TPA: four-helix bundle copper-binding protein [Rickettsiales bacterium]|nr:four-helix bundle copper-binding protein [Rickettsiales bacterium]